MRTVDIVLRIQGHEDQIVLTIGDNKNYDSFYRLLGQAIAGKSATIVHKGDYFRYDHHLLPIDLEPYSTYVLFRNVVLNDPDNDDAVWGVLTEALRHLDFPEVRESEGGHQLIELSSMADELNTTAGKELPEFEDILIRIPGSREELEFDPAGAESNKFLYDRMAKLIYDRDAEVMYKGPKLIFEENRDLFFHSDAFSTFVLFRSRRDSNYDDSDQLWANLAGDLKTLSRITLYRTADNYQVLLLTHEEDNRL